MKQTLKKALQIEQQLEHKTIKEWFEFLPQSIKAEAIYLAIDSNTYGCKTKHDSLAEAIVSAFPHDHEHAATDWTSYYLTLKENNQ